MKRGTINFFDTHIGAWETDVNFEAVRRRLRAVLGRMVRRGFRVSLDSEVASNRLAISASRYVGRKGDLEFAARAAGRMFQIEFFQNVANVDNRNGGRYCSEKFARMPRTMQLACAVEMSHVLQKLVALGYVLEGRRQGIVSTDLLSVLRHAQGRTDEGDPLAEFNRRWSFESDWERGGRYERDESGWPSAKEYGRWPATDRDGLPIVSGETMYCRRAGRLFRGVARPNMNDMWILIANGECAHVQARQLFRCADPAAEPRRLVPGQLKRVRDELSKALEAQSYRRVEALARVAARLPPVEALMSQSNADWSRCAYKKDYDRETLEPVGKECGRSAVEVIHWKDGRASPACRDHGRAALTAEARALVRAVVALDGA